VAILRDSVLTKLMDTVDVREKSLQFMLAQKDASHSEVFKHHIIAVLHEF